MDIQIYYPTLYRSEAMVDANSCAFLELDQPREADERIEM
jgi:hypothetical protein